jgi:hypothetical protein
MTGLIIYRSLRSSVDGASSIYTIIGTISNAQLIDRQMATRASLIAIDYYPAAYL